MIYSEGTALMFSLLRFFGLSYIYSPISAPFFNNIADAQARLDHCPCLIWDYLLFQCRLRTRSYAAVNLSIFIAARDRCDTPPEDHWRKHTLPLNDYDSPLVKSATPDGVLLLVGARLVSTTILL